jgi:hypothetical protein
MSLTDSGTRYEVREQLTSIMKVYPGFVKLQVLNEPFNYRRYDYDQKRYKSSDKKKAKTPEDPAEIEKRNEWRARSSFIDLALANSFDLFPTFTFDPQKVDRYDVDGLKRHMSHWFGNQRNIHGKFRYLILPQYHEDNAIHFHAMFGDYNGNVVDTGHKDRKGQTKLEVKSYQLGMSKAFTIGNTLKDRQRTTYYIARYIARDMPKFRGKHRYWASIGLKRPLKVRNPLLTDDDKARFHETPTKSTRLKTYELHGQFSDADLARIADFGRRREDDLWVAEW